MPVFVPDRKRTLRGERRVASLLDAAGHVFGELGYHAANTNAIAAEAKVSPATLYQFFPNKEAIADALETRYAMELRTYRNLRQRLWKRPSGRSPGS